VGSAQGFRARLQHLTQAVEGAEGSVQLSPVKSGIEAAQMSYRAPLVEMLQDLRRRSILISDFREAARLG
jgi:hypothetical protein